MNIGVPFSPGKCFSNEQEETTLLPKGHRMFFKRHSVWVLLVSSTKEAGTPGNQWLCGSEAVWLLNCVNTQGGIHTLPYRVFSLPNCT